MKSSSWTSFNILVTGIGGQGVLLVSKVIAAAAMDRGLFACRTESRGLSQRGGSVCSEVRFGWSELTPAIGTGEEDLIIALDGLEAARMLPLLKKGGIMLANLPVVIPSHFQRQPDFNETKRIGLEELVGHTLASHSNSIAVDFDGLVRAAECATCLNSALMGAANAFIPLPISSIRNSLMAHVKPQYAEQNLRAFEVGQRVIETRGLESQFEPISA